MKKITSIMYCSTICNVEALHLFLMQNDIKSVTYTSATNSRIRKINVSLWHSDNVKIIIATSAFGLGIDKKNVRFVMHLNMCDSFATYVQQIGRAGRDGCPSETYLFYNFAQFKS